MPPSFLSFHLAVPNPQIPQSPPIPYTSFPLPSPIPPVVPALVIDHDHSRSYAAIVIRPERR